MEWLKLTEYETGEPCLVEEKSIVIVVPMAPMAEHPVRTRIETKTKTVVYVRESSPEVIDLIGDDLDV